MSRDSIRLLLLLYGERVFYGSVHTFQSGGRLITDRAKPSRCACQWK